MSRKKGSTVQPAQSPSDLQESEARFSALFEISPVGIGIMSLERKILDANPAMCRMLGITRAELIGKTPEFATYPDDYPASTHEFEELISGKREYIDAERRYIHKNGETFWVRVTISIVRSSDGKPSYLIGMVVDINEQKMAHAQLEESEQRLRAIFENAGIGIALVDLQRRPLAMNDAMLKISGYTRQEMLNTSGYDLIYPPDQDLGRAEFKDLLARKINSFQVERRYQQKNGNPYWVRQTISAVCGRDNQVQYLIIMVEDIEEEKRAQERLLESEARFRTVFENTAMGIVILDVKTLSMRVNAAAREILDDPNLARRLNSVHELVHVNYQEAESELFQELIDGKRDHYEVEHRYQRPGQEPSWVYVTFSAIRDSAGELIYLVAMLKNITEQKKTQQHLIESEARFRAMFDNVSVGMSMMSLERRILAVNQTAEQIIGYTAEELSKIDPSDLIYSEDRQIGAEHLGELMAGKRDNWRVERRYLRKNNEIFWGRVTYSLVRDAEGKPQYLIGLIEDITEQKLAAEKLAAQEARDRRTLEQRVEERTRALSEANLRLVNEIEGRQRAEEALAAKAVESAISAERTRLARDLHDAVTQTLFSASLIAEVLPELWEMYPDEARKSNEELRQLTRGALAEMRTLLLELRPTALTQARFPDLIKQLSEAVIGRARLPVDLKVTGDYELPPDVKVAFYRIAQESLNNIVKYGRASQVQISINLDCCNVHMEIKDDGVGFDPSAVKPTSLGMRIMRERAEAIHARVSISSTPGQGTMVSVNWNEDEAASPQSNLTNA
jgi:PAS domain S-box-containing protein